MKSKPVVTTAKVRGIIKKNNIGYVDATRRYYPTIAKGVHVWQLSSSICFQVYGHGEETKRQEILKQFTEVLAIEGFAVKSSDNSFEIVGA
jgi:starvation-inducible outer membrane lipoprotein